MARVIIVTSVPHKGHCLAVIFDDCAFRASGFMNKADADGLLIVSKVDVLMDYVSVYKDCIAVNPKVNNPRKTLATLRKYNVPHTSL